MMSSFFSLSSAREKKTRRRRRRSSSSSSSDERTNEREKRRRHPEKPLKSFLREERSLLYNIERLSLSCIKKKLTTFVFSSSFSFGPVLL